MLAAVVFVLMRWLLPWAFPAAGGASNLSGSVMGTLAMLAAKFAPLAGGLILLVWVAAEIKKRMDGGRLDRQAGARSIRELSWREFESLLSEAFRRHGFAVEHTGGTSPDGGIDQRLTKAGAVTLVQCKHWKSQQVGVKVVRELLGVVSSERAQSGILVTSGTFTPDAIEFAAKNPIRLIDGRELVEMIGEVQKSGRIAGSAQQLTAMATPPAAATSSASEIKCPACGAAMVRRVAKKGPNAGGQFMGCSRYPACKGIVNLG